MGKSDSDSSSTFLGLAPGDAPPGGARYAVLPLAYESTDTYGKGAERGPSAIIDASAHIEAPDEELGYEPCEAGIETLDGPRLEGLAPEEMIIRVRERVGLAIERGRHLICLGGEHTITVPAVAATKDAMGEFHVLQIGAHANLQDTHKGTRYSHGCAMARVHEMGPAITQVGTRSRARGDEALLDSPDIRTFWMHDLRRLPVAEWVYDVVQSLGPRVYLTFDVDALDSGIMPATGTPEPGGLRWHETLELLSAVASQREVIGSDFVGLAPIAGMRAPDFAVARLIYKWIGYLEDARRRGGS